MRATDLHAMILSFSLNFWTAHSLDKNRRISEEQTLLHNPFAFNQQVIKKLIIAPTLITRRTWSHISTSTLRQSRNFHQITKRKAIDKTSLIFRFLSHCSHEKLLNWSKCCERKALRVLSSSIKLLFLRRVIYLLSLRQSHEILVNNLTPSDWK